MVWSFLAIRTTDFEPLFVGVCRWTMTFCVNNCDLRTRQVPFVPPSLMLKGGALPVLILAKTGAG